MCLRDALRGGAAMPVASFLSNPSPQSWVVKRNGQCLPAIAIHSLGHRLSSSSMEWMENDFL